ncbi:MAG: hypothetical protein NTZ13_01225 [Candidatus Parcubacteria bacterium]|nr:hypothetical protein [Candidatus Parcubacteria bacterium]
MPYTKEQLDTMFYELPDDVKEAMTSVDTVQVLNEIKEKHKLHIDQIGQLSAEIALVMIGASSPQRFISKMESSMNISEETAKNIASEVNEKVFQVVRNTLKNIQEEENLEEKKENKEQVPQKPKVMDPYRESI